MLNGLLFQMQHYPVRFAWVVTAIVLVPVWVIA